MSNTTIPVKFKLGTNIDDIAKNNNIEQGALYLEQKTNDFNLYFGVTNLKLLPIYQPVRINDAGGVEIGVDAAALNTNNVATSGVAIGKNAKVTVNGAAVGYNAFSTRGFAGGEGATAHGGGAIGYNAYVGYGGGAVGDNAYSTFGGAMGSYAYSTSGGAVGYNASSTLGGAVGDCASSTYGGAVGYQAFSTQGGAVGYNALAINYKEKVTAVLAGSSLTLNNVELSTNTTDKSKFYFKISNAVYYGSKCIDTISRKSSNDKYLYTIVFKNMSSSSSNRDVTVYLINDNYAGGAVGYNANTKTGSAIGYNASSTLGGAMGSYASSTSGGAIGYNASSTTGFAGGQNAKATANGAVQLGEGTNDVVNTLKFRGYQLMDANGYFITNKYGTSDPSGTATVGSIYYKIIS